MNKPYSIYDEVLKQNIENNNGIFTIALKNENHFQILIWLFKLTFMEIVTER